LSKATEVSIHQVQGHLHSVELEPVLGGSFQYVEVNARILMPGEADEPNLARLFGGDESLHRPSGGKDPVGIVEAEDFMMLQ
jgi:hypothetical protein